MTLYENKATLEIEERDKSRIERMLGVKYEKLPIHFGVDFAAIKQSGFADHFAELKSRTFGFDRYEEIVLSYDKVLKAREHSSATGLPVFLFAAFTCGTIARTRLDDVSNWRPKWGGRTTKTRRTADITLAVMIPREWFEIL